MCEHVLRVKTFRIKGFDSPAKQLHQPGALTYSTSIQLTLSGYHVCNLNDRIFIRFGKDTFATSTLDIEGQNSQGRNMRPVAFRRVRLDGLMTNSVS